MQSANKIFNISKNLNKVNLRSISKSTATSEVIKEDESNAPSFLEDDSENRIKKVRTNKSGLLSQDWKKLHGLMPYSEPQSWIHLREKYQRKMYALHGNDSGIDPRICFPTKDDLIQKDMYDKYAEPYTLKEMMDKVRLENHKKNEEIKKREDEIAKKLEKLEQWKADLNAKIAKKEAETLAAKERKERLIEEVRRHFGFKVDPRDERFKEMLEQKEREDKKKQKEAKRKAKEEKMMAKLIDKNSGDNKSTD